MWMVSASVLRCCVAISLLLLIGSSVATVMGEQCDWVGSGLSDAGAREVTPVYLRCSEGSVNWAYPRGALRVVLRLGASGRDFRGCVKAEPRFAGARVYLEGERSLAPLLAKGEARARCFHSRKGRAALYVEAESVVAAPARQVAAFTYDLQALPKGPDAYDPVEECRPCSNEEMTRAFCTSDLVARGIIKSVETNDELEVAHLRIKVTKRLRHSTVDNSISPQDDEVLLQVPAHCGVRRGTGEFVLMARRKLGELSLVCAPRLQDWAQLLISDAASAHCVLAS